MNLINQYLQNVRKELICSRRLKRYFINDLKDNILDSNKKFNSIKDLEDQFGSPIEIRDGFKELNISHLKAKMKKMFIIEMALLALLILSLIIYGIIISIYNDTIYVVGSWVWR